jgi:trimethylguanosine synthase
MEHLASGDITDELNEATAEVTEMDGGPSFSCSSLNYHETSEGPPNDESCLNKSSDEVSMEIGVATGNSMPGLTIVPANGSFEHADECLVNGSCDDEVALHLPSAVQECMDGYYAFILIFNCFWLICSLLENDQVTRFDKHEANQ